MPSSSHKPQPKLPLGYTREGKLITLTGTDFTRHKHILGISGSGKSSFLASCAIMLLRQGIPFCLIDPHQDLGDLILSLLASGDFFEHPQAFNRLMFIDFARRNAAVPFNVLKQPYPPHNIASHFLDAIKRAWPTQSATALMDNVTLFSCEVLVENNLPITDIDQLLLDQEFRNRLLQRVTDEKTVRFFTTKFQENKGSGLVDSTMRRTSLLTFSPSLRYSLGQRENLLDFRYIIDHGISCIFNLGGLDDSTKRLIGCLLMVGLENAFKSRVDMPPEKRLPMHVMVDEFALFSASDDSFTRILEEVRKYKGTLYLAHQTTSQLSRDVAGSLQNALSILMMSGYEDSSYLAQRFVKTKKKPEYLFDFLGLFDTPSENPFENAQTLDERKQIFENLECQQAICNIGKESVLFTTLPLPQITVSRSKLQEIKDKYVKKLLTPINAVEKARASSGFVIVPGGGEDEMASAPPRSRRAQRRSD